MLKFKRTTYLFLSIFLLVFTLNSTVSAAVKTIYGADDRLQYYKVDTTARLADKLPYYLEVASSVCLITFKSYIGDIAGSSQKKLYIYGTLAEVIGKAACNNLAFRNEPVVNGCGTGTLVADQYVLTSDHVYTDMSALAPNNALVCIFNYFKRTENDLPICYEGPNKTKPYVLINASYIYDVSAKDYGGTNTNNQNEWVLLRLAKIVANTQHRMCYSTKTKAQTLSDIGIQPESNELFTWGFPMGIPMTFIDNGHLLPQKNGYDFMVDLDAYHGNSGGAIFVKYKTADESLFKYKIQGTLWGGQVDFTPPGPNDCITDYVRPVTSQDLVTCGFVDSLFASSAISNGNCNMPGYKPIDTIIVKPTTQKVRGQTANKLPFNGNANQTYTLRFFWTQDNKNWSNTSSNTNVNGYISFSTFFIPQGANYYYRVLDQLGNTVVGPIYGTATGGAISFFPYVPAAGKVSSMAYVGKTPTVYPYGTIQSAIDNSVAGDVLHIAPGIYNEVLRITKPIVLNGDVDGGTLVIGPANYSSTSNVAVYSNNITIRNICFKDPNGENHPLSMHGVSNCTIENNIFIGGTGIYMQHTPTANCISNTISGNYFYGLTDKYDPGYWKIRAISLEDVTGNTFTNNVLFDGASVFDFTYYNAATTIANNTFTNNVISHPYTQTATGYFHSLFLKGDGTLWACGANNAGQLGDGTTTGRTTPYQVMSDVKSIAGNYYQSFIILRWDGSLWGCGANSFGQLGDGSTSNQLRLKRLMDNVQSISAGVYHTLILSNDGSLYVTGYNNRGQLGTGDVANRYRPFKIMTGVKTMSAGNYHSLAMKTDGSVWAFGANTYGQLGNGQTVDQKTPVQVMAGDVSKFSAGNSYSYFLMKDGSLWACGNNSYGQLGDGTQANRISQVKIMSAVKNMLTGTYYSLILRDDNSLWACGENKYGQFGDGTTTNSLAPKQVNTDVRFMSLGSYHSIIVKLDGTLWTCGMNNYGQLGDGTTISKSTPVKLAF